MLQTLSLFLAVAVAAVAQPSIKKVVPMASDDNVKMEITLSKGADASCLHAGITACSDGSLLWEGSLNGLGSMTNDSTFTCVVNNLRPQLWSTVSPVLYNLTVSLGEEQKTVRMGFRRFEMKDGNFYLNGRPVFLRGNAINPPGRGIPSELEKSKEFARDYVRFLKGMNINIIRIPNNQNWLDVCDEEGMMIFGGRYGRPHGGSLSAPPQNLDESVNYYKEVELGILTNHPSVVIYVLSNEMPYKGKVGDAYRRFFKEAYDQLKEWDHTRQYICNAGYGLGKSADVYDVHRYWGWYYNSYLTFLNLRQTSMWQNPGRTQAITFTECVGNYTGIDGRFNLCSRTKQPGSQKCWTGHISQTEQAAEALEYQAFVLKNATEMFRRLRTSNPYLSGVMPFTIMFHDWDGIQSFAQMRPKPAAFQYMESYQPVLLSWENWHYNVKAGVPFSLVAHVVNDDDLGRALDGARIEWKVEDIDRRCVATGSESLPHMDYYCAFARSLSICLPEDILPGEYTLRGVVLGSGGEVISSNNFKFFAAPASWSNTGSHAGAKINLYDPEGTTAKAFTKLGVNFTRLQSLDKLSRKTALVLGDDALTVCTDAQKTALRKFAEQGGRIFVLRQAASKADYKWIDEAVRPLRISNNDPTYLSPEFEYVDGMNINIERGEHPVFQGLNHRHMRLWADYTGFDERMQGFPKVYPVSDGFYTRGIDLSKATVLANYSRNLASTAMAEFQLGKGIVFVSAFDLVNRVGVDPVAEKMLLNLVTYAASGEVCDPYRIVGNVIEWGNYDSENGIVTGSGNGLVVNPYPIVPQNRVEEYPVKVDARGYHYAVSYGGWNTRPGVQYVPRGRRPFAPFTYSLGGNDVLEDGAEGQGEGYFTAQVPAGSKTMSTLLENNATEEISVVVSLNGTDSKTVTIPAGKQVRVEHKLPGDGRIKVSFKGDRRTVILRTEFN